MTKRVLTINPGSTSTKIAVFEDGKEIFITTIRHTSEELKDFACIVDQFSFRKELILEELKKANIAINTLSVIVGRGGLVKPIESGIYEVNDSMEADLRKGVLGEHASNLGGLIARDIAIGLKGVKAYIADPVVVDEMIDVARISGHPEFERISIFHALNQKAIAREYAKSVGKKYEELNLVVVHLGGGVSVGAHEKGRVIDVNNALYGEGPFSPERSGGIAAWSLIDYCFSGKATQKEIKSMITGKGGMVAYLGTNNAYEVKLMAEAGDKKAQLIQDALAFQTCKEIGSMAVVMKGKVDAILITGGIAHNEGLVNKMAGMVSFIAPVHRYPGEDEMAALANNGFMVLNGEIQSKIYK